MKAALIWYATLAAMLAAYLVGIAMSGPTLGAVYAGFALYASVQFLE